MPRETNGYAREKPIEWEPMDRQTILGKFTKKEDRDFRENKGITITLQNLIRLQQQLHNKTPIHRYYDTMKQYLIGETAMISHNTSIQNITQIIHFAQYYGKSSKAACNAGYIQYC